MAARDGAEAIVIYQLVPDSKYFYYKDNGVDGLRQFFVVVWFPGGQEHM